jgi:hypothetical protein
VTARNIGVGCYSKAITWYMRGVSATWHVRIAKTFLI